jgi:hypothetical protein
MAVRSTVRHAPFFERLLIVAINRKFEITKAAVEQVSIAAFLLV